MGYSEWAIPLFPHQIQCYIALYVLCSIDPDVAPDCAAAHNYKNFIKSGHMGREVLYWL